MKAVGYLQPLPIEHDDALLDIDLPDLMASGRDLLVEVKAISVNPVDTKVRSGSGPMVGHRYRVLGWDACGIVSAVGPQVTLFRPGDRVWYTGSIARPGTNKEGNSCQESASQEGTVEESGGEYGRRNQRGGIVRRCRIPRSQRQGSGRSQQGGESRHGQPEEDDQPADKAREATFDHQVIAGTFWRRACGAFRGDTVDGERQGGH